MSTMPSEKNEEAMTVILAEFDGPSQLYHAAEKMRDAGYRTFDCHSPFPIHGMDRAMGLGRSWLAVVCFVVAMSFLLAMIGFVYYVSMDYKLVISGKPYFSYVAYTPPVYAIGILTCAFTAVFGMMAFNKLPRPHHPLFNSENFARVTHDAFFVSVPSDDPQFDEAKVKAFLTSIGGKNLEVLKDE
jgi:hypothetical protein